MKKKQRTMAPRDAMCFNDVCKLQTDHFNSASFWMSFEDDVVHIYAQRSGEAATASITIDRSVFNRMIQWWMRPQKLRTKVPA